MNAGYAMMSLTMRVRGCYNSILIKHSIWGSKRGMELDFSSNLKAHQEREGLLIIFSGPSGVGKDTLLVELEARCPALERCVTYTTRAPRPKEIPGQDYNFIGVDEFKKMIDDGDFLEYAHVHLDYYGSPLSSVTPIRERGRDAVLKIDVQGGLAVKAKAPEAIMIFIAPPSLEELERRLRSRYTDTEAAITKRLQNAHNEIAQIPKYDYLVVNDNIDEAVDRLRCIIVAERSRIHGWE